jgi:hypothetical protein
VPLGSTLLRCLAVYVAGFEFLRLLLFLLAAFVAFLFAAYPGIVSLLVCIVTALSESATLRLLS